MAQALKLNKTLVLVFIIPQSHSSPITPDPPKRNKNINFTSSGSSRAPTDTDKHARETFVANKNKCFMKFTSAQTIKYRVRRKRKGIQILQSSDIRRAWISLSNLIARYILASLGNLVSSTILFTSYVVVALKIKFISPVHKSPLLCSGFNLKLTFFLDLDLAMKISFIQKLPNQSCSMPFNV
jgi:hypothetical protein